MLGIAPIRLTSIPKRGIPTTQSQQGTSSRALSPVILPGSGDIPGFCPMTGNSAMVKYSGWAVRHLQYPVHIQVIQLGGRPSSIGS